MLQMEISIIFGLQYSKMRPNEVSKNSFELLDRHFVTVGCELQTDYQSMFGSASLGSYLKTVTCFLFLERNKRTEGRIYYGTQW